MKGIPPIQMFILFCPPIAFILLHIFDNYIFLVNSYNLYVNLILGPTLIYNLHYYYYSISRLAPTENCPESSENERLELTTLYIKAIISVKLFANLTRPYALWSSVTCCVHSAECRELFKPKGVCADENPSLDFYPFFFGRPDKTLCISFTVFPSIKFKLTKTRI